MLELGFLVSSYLKTVCIKSPGRKKIFCVFSDTLVCLACYEILACFSLNHIYYYIYYYGRYLWPTYCNHPVIFKLPRCYITVIQAHICFRASPEQNTMTLSFPVTGKTNCGWKAEKKRVLKTDPWEKKTMGKGGEFGGSAAEEPERKQI